VQKGILRDLGKYGAVGIEFAACVLIGVAIGYAIDRKIKYIKPWATLLFSILGFLAGMKRLMAIGRAIKEEGGGNKRD
jgi:F0F1-type ATP synthase assembly protein I